MEKPKNFSKKTVECILFIYFFLEVLLMSKTMEIDQILWLTGLTQRYL